jgi:hypothetical protein
MKKPQRTIIIAALVAAAIIAGWLVLYEPTVTIEQYSAVDSHPRIRPDYTEIVIPPNIAPLNFAVQEPGIAFFVRISADHETPAVSSSTSRPSQSAAKRAGLGLPQDLPTRPAPIEIHQKSPNIIIPNRPWRKLLQANRGGTLAIDVYVKNTYGAWLRYRTITNTIANHEIDPYLVYRRMKPIFTFWYNIGIYQRHLETYDESPILHGDSFSKGCLNCHTFRNNQPDEMFIGLRSAAYGSGTLYASPDGIDIIGAKWGYTAWHPTGKIAAYAMVSVRQFFHAAGMEVRDVIDLDGTILYYDFKTKSVKDTPGLADIDRMETYPTWSPDGRFLYFCSAPILWEDRQKWPPKRFKDVKYDLMRISYDPQTDKWGQPETVLAADQTGLSILLPRISPDGRLLLFSMCKYGCFPVLQPTSDLYMMDLSTGQYNKLPINSQFSESWHSFSSNGRWIVFSSKRRGGLFTRSYISYVDLAGNVHKQFVLPQKDPLFYDSLPETYSVPELITGPVPFRQRSLSAAVRSSDKINIDIPITSATPKATSAQQGIDDGDERE